MCLFFYLTWGPSGQYPQIKTRFVPHLVFIFGKYPPSKKEFRFAHSFFSVGMQCEFGKCFAFPIILFKYRPFGAGYPPRKKKFRFAHFFLLVGMCCFIGAPWLSATSWPQVDGAPWNNRCAVIKSLRQAKWSLLITLRVIRRLHLSKPQTANNCF